ncbi:1, 4-beta cellobiohydrolase [Panaeolus papilionaceus]|nr:1, 4-beta cellobiohydrolase [Panaeolus papilionaceus]
MLGVIYGLHFSHTIPLFGLGLPRSTTEHRDGGKARTATFHAAQHRCALQLSIPYYTSHLMLESHSDAPPAYDKPSAAEGISFAMNCALDAQRDLAKARKIAKRMDEIFSLRIHDPLRDAENTYRISQKDSNYYRKIRQLRRHKAISPQVVEDIDSEHTDDVFDEDVDKLTAILRRSIVSPLRTFKLSLWRQGVGEIITPFRRTTPILNSATVSIRDIEDTGDVEVSDISDVDDFHSARSSPSPAQSFETLELGTISRHQLTDANYLELKNEADNLVTVIDSIVEELEKWKSALHVFDTIWGKLKRDASDLCDYITGDSLEDQEMVAMTLDQAGFDSIFNVVCYAGDHRINFGYNALDIRKVILCWNDNLALSAALFAEVLKMAQAIRPGAKVRGLATNVSNYNQFNAPVHENITESEWNQAWDESRYINLLKPHLEERGFPARFIVDQGRAGRAGIRTEWGQWCNVRNAGFGVRPTTDQGVIRNEAVDALVWVKPGGESDGTSDEGAQRFDEVCRSAVAHVPAPEAGAWFNEYVVGLVKNANPELEHSWYRGELNS